jgi:hypothetical protein
MVPDWLPKLPGSPIRAENRTVLSQPRRKPDVDCQIVPIGPPPYGPIVHVSSDLFSDDCNVQLIPGAKMLRRCPVQVAFEASPRRGAFWLVVEELEPHAPTTEARANTPAQTITLCRYTGATPLEVRRA